MAVAKKPKHLIFLKWHAKKRLIALHLMESTHRGGLAILDRRRLPIAAVDVPRFDPPWRQVPRRTAVVLGVALVALTGLLVSPLYGLLALAP